MSCLFVCLSVCLGSLFLFLTYIHTACCAPPSRDFINNFCWCKKLHLSFINTCFTRAQTYLLPPCPLSSPEPIVRALPLDLIHQLEYLCPSRTRCFVGVPFSFHCFDTYISVFLWLCRNKFYINIVVASRSSRCRREYHLRIFKQWPTVTSGRLFETLQEVGSW